MSAQGTVSIARFRQDDSPNMNSSPENPRNYSTRVTWMYTVERLASRLDLQKGIRLTLPIDLSKRKRIARFSIIIIINYYPKWLLRVYLTDKAISAIMMG